MPGEVRALIGSNGAGKSTLIKMLTGAIGADQRQRRDRRASACRLGDPLGDDPPRRRLHLPALATSRRRCRCSTTSSSAASRRALGPRRRAARSGGEAQALLAAPRHRRSTSMRVVGSLPTVKQKEVEIVKALGARRAGAADGRADRLARRRRRRPAARDDPRAEGARRRHRLHQPHARRDLRRLRHADGHARRARGRRTRGGRHRPAARRRS